MNEFVFRELDMNNPKDVRYTQSIMKAFVINQSRYLKGMIGSLIRDFFLTLAIYRIKDIQ